MSGGNANVTISNPTRPDWKVLWGNGAFDNFQLDIVGFLAVLGEASVSANYQVGALSRLFYLPRLIPAPQALLPSRRPMELPTKFAWVTGVKSGNMKEHIHHVASILLDNDMDPFDVRCVRVKKRENMLRRVKSLDTMLRGMPKEAKQSPYTDDLPPTVKAKATGPQAAVTILGFLMSLTLFISSILWGDGMSLVATILLSLLSTLIGAANKWTLRLPQRKGPSPTEGDTVIRYPNGSFLVVICDETVARELYFAPEGIEYNITNPTVYRLISLVGTIMLMLGVVALANAKLQLQFAWAGAYIFINVAYWIAAAVPPKLHWDLSCYEVVEQSIDGDRGCRNPNFTQALWKAILVTKSTRWAQIGKAAPHTDVWEKWLARAEKKANSAGKIIGPARYPFLWPQDTDPLKRVIWNVPRNTEGDGKEWDAKRDWDLIHKGEDPDAPRPSPEKDPPEDSEASENALPQKPQNVKWRHKYSCM
jgi:hypothetical protein